MKCSICGKEIEKQINPKTGKVFWDKGNNAQPINNGRCCNACNHEYVIPKRVEQLLKK